MQPTCGATNTGAALPEPFFPAGTVYGTLLNFRAELNAFAPRMHDAPYKAPPKAPVLYVKPANTWSADGAQIVVPAHVPLVDVGATIAMVMGASGAVAGYVLMNDLSVPHTSYFRPPVKARCLDGFLGIGATLLPAGPALDPSRFRLDVRINGDLKQTIEFANLVRGAAQLLTDVGEFMTLGAGDALMLGCDIIEDGSRPLAQVGDRIVLSAAGMGSLTNLLVAEPA